MMKCAFILFTFLCACIEMRTTAGSMISGNALLEQSALDLKPPNECKNQIILFAQFPTHNLSADICFRNVLLKSGQL
jgi:hypothetical protein